MAKLLQCESLEIRYCPERLSWIACLLDVKQQAVAEFDNRPDPIEAYITLTHLPEKRAD